MSKEATYRHVLAVSLGGLMEPTSLIRGMRPNMPR